MKRVDNTLLRNRVEKEGLETVANRLGWYGKKGRERLAIAVGLFPKYRDGKATYRRFINQPTAEQIRKVVHVDPFELGY